MPRGYLRRQAGNLSGIGRKQGRGGQSKKSGRYKEFPAIVPAMKDSLRRQRNRDIRCEVEDEITGGLDVYYNWYDEDCEYYNDEDSEDYDSEHYHEDHGFHREPSCVISDGRDKPSLVTYEKAVDVECDQSEEKSFLCMESVLSEIGSSENSVEMESDSTDAESFLCVESIVSEGMSGTGLSGPSYSFCNESFMDSDSFSLLSVSGDNNTVSSKASTLWHFVDDVLPGDSKPVDYSEVEEPKQEDGASSLSSMPTITTQQNIAPLRKTSADLIVPKQCAICLSEKGDIIRLFHKCNHPQACRSCLWTHYVKHIIHARNAETKFPLRCFWPGCHRTLRDTQMRYIVNNQYEMDSYYSLCNEVKQAREEARKKRMQSIVRQALQERRALNFKTLQSCSACAAPNPVQPSRETHFACVRCQKVQKITVISRKEIRSIVEAVGDFLVNCPSCERLICKEGGCDHMTCVCEHEFSFVSAQAKLRRYVASSSCSGFSGGGLAIIQEQTM